MTLDSLSKWDRRFLDLAQTVGGWSKGPRKRVGAVIVRPDRSVASMGYNGPPRGFDDEAFLAMTRDEQHKVAVHAEANAMLQMNNVDVLLTRLRIYTMFVSPLYPCSDCAKDIIAIGIKRVVAYCGHVSPDWEQSAKDAEELFKKNGVEYLFVKD